MEWEQPYYDLREKRRQQKLKAKAKHDNNQEVDNVEQELPGLGESGEGNEPLRQMGRQFECLVPEKGPQVPIFHQVLHGDVEMPQLVLVSIYL